jgi:hypothetical protein
MSAMTIGVPEALIEFRTLLSKHPEALAAVRHIVQTAMGTAAYGVDLIDGSPDPEDRVLLLAAMHDWYYRQERLHGWTGWLIIESPPTNKDTEQLPPVTCDSVSLGQFRTAVFFLAFQQRVESHIAQYGAKSCVDLCLHGDTVAVLLGRVSALPGIGAAPAGDQGGKADGAVPLAIPQSNEGSDAKPIDPIQLPGAVSPDCGVTASAGTTKAESPKDTGGRPGLPTTEARKRTQLIREWHDRKGRVSQKEFCRDRGIALAYLQKCVNWYHQRKRRADER